MIECLVRCPECSALVSVEIDIETKCHPSSLAEKVSAYPVATAKCSCGWGVTEEEIM